MAICPECRTHYDDDVTTCEKDGERLLPDEAFDAADKDLPVGDSVGEYRIEAKLGEGGFGAVYRAVQPLIGKAVAIKVLNREHSSNPQTVSRFVDEARAVNQIRHKNIIDIFSFNKLPDGRQYFVMELLEGVTLDRLIADRGRLVPELAIPILRGVARALDAAHSHGIAHRDLKPENVFLADDGDGGVSPKLLDFGIAKLMAGSAGHKTRTGAPLGTPAYMSPEQCHALHVDQRTDIYSFGILAHEVLSGKLPFDGRTVMQILVKQTTAEAPALSSVCAELSSQLDAPILKMLEKEADARPQTIVEAVEELAAAAVAAGYKIAGVPVTASAARTSGAGGTKLVSGPVLNSTPSGLTPTDIALLGEAKTIATGPSGRTLQGAAADVPRPRRGLVFAGGAIAIVAAVAAFTFWRPQPPAIPSPPTRAADSPKSTVEAVSVPPVVPAASTSEDTEADVEIEIESVPQDTEVLHAGKKIGSAPGTIQLARGDEKVKLTLRADGYRDLVVEVTPDKDRTIAVGKMTKLGAPPPKAGTAAPKASKTDLQGYEEE